MQALNFETLCSPPDFLCKFGQNIDLHPYIGRIYSWSLTIIAQEENTMKKLLILAPKTPSRRPPFSTFKLQTNN